MKIAFFHSHKFRYDGTSYYSTGGLNTNVLSKYIGEKDEIFVYARVIPLKHNEHLSSITDPRIHVRAYSEVNLREAINIADLCIMRLPSPVGIKACRISRKIGKPYLVEVVGCIWDSYWNYGIRGKIMALPGFLITRDFIRKAKYVTYVTQDFLQKRYPTNGKSIGVSDVEMPKIEEQVLRSRLNLIDEKRDKIILGTVAAVDVKYKGQKNVIQALGALKRRGMSDYKYWLIGAGNPKRLKLLSKKYDVEDQVIFMGSKPHEEVFSLLDKIDVYIQPSYQEGLCRALLEALSRGCPSIASNVGGNYELVDKKAIYKNGIQCYKQIARLIQGLSINEMKVQAKKNIETAKSYDASLLNKRWNDFYSNFICEAKKQR